MSKMGFVAAVAGLAAMMTAGSAIGDDPVTTVNFIGRLSDAHILTQMHGDVETFDCVDAASSPDRKFCEGKIKFPDFGVMISARTAMKTEELTYASEMMASPGISPDEKKQAMFGVFLVMAMRIVATFNPEVPKERRFDVVNKLMLGINNDANEAKLGKWVYSAGNGIFVTFAAERADDRYDH